MRKVRILSLVLLSVLALSGCYRYSCPAPEGTSCKPISEIYRQSGGSDNSGKTSAPGKQKENKSVKQVSLKKGKEAPKSPEIERGEEIKIQGPTILPIKIYRYIDSEGDLHRPGYLFVVINKEEWSIEDDKENLPMKPVKYHATDDRPVNQARPASDSPAPSLNTTPSQVKNSPDTTSGTFWDGIVKSQATGGEITLPTTFNTDNSGGISK